MSSIRKLAHQTLWYGGSYVAARSLNVFLKFVLTYFITTSSYGEMAKVYVYTTFLAVLFTYGMETAYFRFAQQEDGHKLFNTSFSSVILSTCLLSVSLIIFARPMAELFRVQAHPEWIRWFAFILGFDALAAIPFARLRQEQRPVKYAFIKFLNIFLQVLLILYFLVICPRIATGHPHSLLLTFYDPSIGVGYVFIANLVASALTLVFLSKELGGFRPRISRRLWKEMILYSLPLLVVGLGGMINEVVDRVLLDHMGSFSQVKRDTIIGVYTVGVQFAMLINIFIQIFRMGAEPFFFNEMNKSNAKETYARVMKLFVIGSSWMFLGIVLFRDVWKAAGFVDIRRHPEYEGSFHVIPELAMAYVCLGVYYNLSVWYKLTNKTMAGAAITSIGAAVTLALNIWWIPRYSYVGCAWASFLCYFVMMIISFVWGQKIYKVPYEWKKLGTYLVVVAAICTFHQWISAWSGRFLFSVFSGAVLLAAFMILTLLKDREEFAKLPVVGKYLRRPADVKTSDRGSRIRI